MSVSRSAAGRDAEKVSSKQTTQAPVGVRRLALPGPVDLYSRLVATVTRDVFAIAFCHNLTRPI